YSSYYADDPHAALSASPTRRSSDLPVVRCPPVAPQLSNASVAPGQAFANTATFTWTVEYRDGDGDAPARIEVTIYKGGSIPVAVDRKSTRLNSSHDQISYAVFCLKK